MRLGRCTLGRRAGRRGRRKRARLVGELRLLLGRLFLSVFLFLFLGVAGVVEPDGG